MTMTNVTEEWIASSSFDALFCKEELTRGLNGHLILFVVLNVFFSVTAFLGNAAILVALHMESSMYPATKVLLRCLSISDLFVGLVTEPTRVTHFLSVMLKHEKICQYTTVLGYVFGYSLSAVSLLTVTAVSLDRLLALLLGLRYRQVVTSKRSFLAAAVIWIVPIVSTAMYFWNSRVTYWFGYVVISLCIVITAYSYTKIFVTLRQHQIQPHYNVRPHQEIHTAPLNIARYKKAVSSSLWVQVTLSACYLPFALIDAFFTQREVSQSLYVARALAITLVYVNSSLNPILYCWKIAGVRRAVKELIGRLFFCYGG
ncbi:adenosine receptor A3-like [Montipora foliosa]|uniref:adenosine receptor A3-like n=1 Tax=Montipora foliosa TaxID=591990 RepID=UPI0035F204BF